MGLPNNTVCNIEQNLLLEKKQIATVYEENPNGSELHVEGLLSPSGRIFGKMGHNERLGENRFINVNHGKEMDIFRSAIDAIKG